MKPFNHLPEEKPEPQMDKQPKDPPKTDGRDAAVTRLPGDAQKKVFPLFRKKSTPGKAGTNPTQPESNPAGPKRSSGQGVPRRSILGGKNLHPDTRLRDFVTPVKTDPPAKAPKKMLLRPSRETTRRAYWDVAAAFSLVVNAILIGVLLVMAGQIRNLKTTMNSMNGMVGGVLGGLYSNFVQMDNAHITSTIPIQTQIQVSFNLPIQQNTIVTLTDSVAVTGAWVVINSGGLSINAPANVTLPAGTNLPIALNLSVPVQTTIPVSLQVPVNIPLNQTDLHAPFAGLQQTIRPLYCTFNKNAQYPQGIYICAGHDAPTPGTP